MTGLHTRHTHCHKKQVDLHQTMSHSYKHKVSAGTNCHNRMTTHSLAFASNIQGVPAGETSERPGMTDDIETVRKLQLIRNKTCQSSI